MPDSKWQQVAAYPSGVEADLAIAMLDAAGIPAIRSGDTTGLFGPGFQGSSFKSVIVSVPDDSVEDAREVLSAEEAADDQ